MNPYVENCPECGAKFKTRSEERKHAYLHTRGERKTDNIHLRIQPSRKQALKVVARDFNLSVPEAIDHAIDETWNV